MSCPEGNSDYYLVFPRSKINRFLGIEDSVRGVAVEDGKLRVTKFEANDGAASSTIYILGMQGGVQPLDLHYDSGYDMLHRKLRAEHKLDHSLEDCPERLHPMPVRVWTPSGGWSEMSSSPRAPINKHLRTALRRLVLDASCEPFSLFTK